MLVLGYVAVVGSVLIALLFVADATLDKNSSPVIVTSQRMGLPEPHYHSAIKTFTITPAPAPDKTSQAVLDAPPKSHAEPKAEHEVLTKIEPLAREARAEAPNLKHVGVEASAKRRGAISKSQHTNYQTDLFVRQIFYQGLLAPDPLLPLDAQPG